MARSQAFGLPAAKPHRAVGGSDDRGEFVTMRYRPILAGRSGARVLVALQTLVGFVIASASITGTFPVPGLFGFLWPVGVVATVYSLSVSVSSELAFDGSVLTALYLFGERAIPIDDLGPIRPKGSKIAIIEVPGQRPIKVQPGKGFRELTDEIQRRRPDLPAVDSWRWRISERLPGRSRLSR